MFVIITSTFAKIAKYTDDRKFESSLRSTYFYQSGTISVGDRRCQSLVIMDNICINNIISHIGMERPDEHSRTFCIN